jgi:hypothetical protein
MIESVLLTLLRFLNHPEEGRRREEKEWRGSEDFRESMWMMEEEGSLDSVILVKIVYGDPSKELKFEGICTGGEDDE